MFATLDESSDPPHCFFAAAAACLLASFGFSSVQSLRPIFGRHAQQISLAAFAIATLLLVGRQDGVVHDS